MNAYVSAQLRHDLCRRSPTRQYLINIGKGQDTCCLDQFNLGSLRTNIR